MDFLIDFEYKHSNQFRSWYYTCWYYFITIIATGPIEESLNLTPD